jgi:hypothetical protein
MSFIRQTGPNFKTGNAKNGTAAGRAYMAKVAQLNCVVCHAFPVEVHHCISDRFSQRKASDFETISLCFAHHRGPEGIHAEKAAWEAKHGKDHSYLSVVQLALKEPLGAPYMRQAAKRNG